MEFRSFEEFWPYYVGKHARRRTRWLHFAGTTAGILFAVAAAALFSPWLLLAVPIAGYGLAWIGHFLVERNRPATFRHPFWSLLGDLRMYRLMWMGRMDDEVRRVMGR